jgi:hypothetical protein
VEFDRMEMQRVCGMAVVVVSVVVVTVMGVWERGERGSYDAHSGSSGDWRGVERDSVKGDAIASDEVFDGSFFVMVVVVSMMMVEMRMR